MLRYDTPHLLPLSRGQVLNCTFPSRRFTLRSHLLDEPTLHTRLSTSNTSFSSNQVMKRMKTSPPSNLFLLQMHLQFLSLVEKLLERERYFPLVASVREKERKCSSPLYIYRKLGLQVSQETWSPSVIGNLASKFHRKLGLQVIQETWPPSYPRILFTFSLAVRYRYISSALSLTENSKSSVFASISTRVTLDL